MRQFHLPPFPLPQRHEELLNQAFGRDNWHEDKQLAGFSGASVYQITYKNNPVVVKIAHPAIIKREQRNYNEFVLDSFHNHAPKLGGYYESADRQEALLRYTYAGNVARSQTLFEFLQQGGPKAVKEACAKLNEMFGVTPGNRPKGWWGEVTAKRVRCAEYYDRWLPVQLTLELLSGAVEHAILLEADKLSQQDLVGLAPGQVVQLKGFQVEKEEAGSSASPKGFQLEKAEAGVVTLYVGRPQAPSLRVKVMGIQTYVDHIENGAPLYAVIKETRKMLLERYAEAAVGTFATQFPTFAIEGHDYPNPFYYLDDLLNTQYETYLATIHGDFNLRNILLEEKPQPAPNRLMRRLHHLLNSKTYDWWLIDFASAQTGPILLDLQWLEAQVINWLLVPALQRAGQGLRALTQVLEGLHRRRSLYFHLRTAELRAIYTLLQEIRRLAESYLAEPAHNPDRWQEYYRGLTLALAATLKQEALKAELGEQAPKFALLAAATTVRWAGIKLAAPVKQRWQPVWLRPVVAPVVIALALALVYYGYRLRQPSLSLPVTPLSIAQFPPLTPTPTAMPPTATSTSIAPTVLPELPSVLVRVRERGHLRCGVNGDLPLFGWDPATPKHRSWRPETPEDVDLYDNAEGFDADFCRVVATAVFGTYVSKVRFVNVGPKERFQALTRNVIDVLSRNTTWTPDRDSSLGVDFAAVNFYSRQQLLVKKATFTRWDELAERRICVLPATTTLANLESLRAKMQWITVTQDREGNFDSNQQVFDAFKAGYCDAFSSDGDQLIAFRSQPKVGENRLYLSPEEYDILEIDDQAIPDEPRALVVAMNDGQWRKVVSYAVWATIYAEELGLTQQNVRDFGATAELRFKEFLGLPDPLIPQGGQIGELLDLSPQFARDIILMMGNYREIYEHHLDKDIPVRGANQSNKLNPTGRLFTPPFVLAQLATPTPVATISLTAIITPTPVSLPIAIGIAIDLQDKESLLGDNQEKGAKIAAELYRTAIPGVDLMLEIRNTNSTTTGAQSAVNTLIAKNVLFIVGPTLSSQAKIVAPIANAQKIPIIGPSNTAKGIAQLGCYVSRISPPVTQLDPLAVQQAYVTHGNIRNVAVAYLQGNAFTEDEAQVFMEEASRTDIDRNWQLVLTQPYTRGAEIDFTPQATNIIDANPDLVMIAGLTKDGGLLAKKLREQQYTGVIVGGNGFNTTGIFNVCQEACNGIILAQAYDSRRERAIGINQQFIETYERAYQSYPSPIAAQMFTAVQIGVEVLKRIAARTDGGLATLTLPALRDEFNKELLAGAPFLDTPLGEIDFAADGEVIQREFYVAQIEIDANGENGHFKTMDESANEAVDALLAEPSDCLEGYLP